MTLNEAIVTCERWIAFGDKRREQTDRIQALARLAKTEPERARRELAQIDRSPLVFGGDLRAAVEQLLAHCRR